MNYSILLNISQPFRVMIFHFAARNLAEAEGNALNHHGVEAFFVCQFADIGFLPVQVSI